MGKKTPKHFDKPEYFNDIDPDDEAFWEWWEIEGVGKFYNEETANLVRRAVNNFDNLREALQTIVTNAKLIQDDDMNGLTDCYRILFEDIDLAKQALSQSEEE